MNGRKVLWIEDDADNDLHNLTSPVHIDGRYQLDIAINAAEALFYLGAREYDVIIVDIRIPPGANPSLKAQHERLFNGRASNANRLGLVLLRAIFKPEDISAIPPGNLRSERYGIFTVEGHEELLPDLQSLGLAGLRYRQKNAALSNTALLDFIDEVFNHCRRSGIN